MPITPTINGYVYWLDETTDNNNLNKALNHLSDLKKLSESTLHVAPNPPKITKENYLWAINHMDAWHNTYTQSHQYQQNYNALSAITDTSIKPALTTLLAAFTEANIFTTDTTTKSSFTDIYTAIFGTDPDKALDDANYTKRLNMVSGILYMRDNLKPLINNVFASLKAEYNKSDNIILRPGLQNYLLYEYAFAAEDLLTSQLNTLGNTVKANAEALEAFNKFGYVLNSNTDLSMKLDATFTSEITKPELISYVKEAITQLIGYSETKFNPNNTLGFICPLPTGVTAGSLTFNITGASSKFNIDQKLMISTKNSFTKAIYKVAAVNTNSITVSAVNPPAPSDWDTSTHAGGLYDYNTITQFSDTVIESFMKVLTNSDLYSYAFSSSPNWFNNLSYHSDVENAVTNVQFLNDTKKQELNEVYFIYTKFLQSAATIMSRLDQTITGSAQRVKSRS